MYDHFIKKVWREAQFRWPREILIENEVGTPVDALLHEVPPALLTTRVHVIKPRQRFWRSPKPETLETPEFEAVWQCIKDWDINVPYAYTGYCGANGNHVRAILDALDVVKRRKKSC